MGLSLILRCSLILFLDSMSGPITVTVSQLIISILYVARLVGFELFRVQRKGNNSVIEMYN